MALSPMMVQYKKIKEQYPDTILMYRLGDFYEMFYDDAVTASNVLGLTLTGRDCGQPERAPMCGVPYHAVQSYIAKLVKAGHKVVLCDQLQDPKEAKGMVERGVTRVVTSGTVTDNDALESNKNNYIMSLYLDDGGVGAVWADITTMEAYTSYIPVPSKVRLNDLLLKIKPSEIICNSKMLEESVELSAVKYGSICELTQYDDEKFDFETSKKLVKTVLSDTDYNRLLKTPACVCAEGGLISYVRGVQFTDNVNLGSPENFESENFMDIDAGTVKTLELVESQSKKRGTTLLEVINRAVTPMGKRLMENWVKRPLYNKTNIENRLDKVEALYSNTVIRERLTSILSNVKDLVRISTSLLRGEIKVNDVINLYYSLESVKYIKKCLKELNNGALTDLDDKFIDCNEDIELIKSAVNFGDNDAKLKVGAKKTDDGDEYSYKIKTGYNGELDNFRSLILNSKSAIDELENKDRERTGIKNLRIKHTNIYGYCIEVQKQFEKNVPTDYIRRQTVKDCERYCTDELIKLQDEINNAKELSREKDKQLYLEVLGNLREHANNFAKTGMAIAELDCLVGLATAAKSNNYCRPTITTDAEITITEGRHPVAEFLPSDEMFVPNDTYLNNTDSKIMLITGPNMAGKSLYMRQVALIVILAQIGSFVPAKTATIGLVDKVFTRVGAYDDISMGRSTFMVEMAELSQILSNATDKSLILLDEIGRGTATYDGLSIAWAVIEHIALHLAAKVLFSTHYHELTELDGTLPGIKNYKFTAKEQDGGIKFVRKIMRGSANKSFGIEVASLAGINNSVTDRAKQILAKLMNADIAHSAKDSRQVSIFDNVSKYDEVIKILKELDIDNISPRTALDILVDLKEKTEN